MKDLLAEWLDNMSDGLEGALCVFIVLFAIPIIICSFLVGLIVFIQAVGNDASVKLRIS